MVPIYNRVCAINAMDAVRRYDLLALVAALESGAENEAVDNLLLVGRQLTDSLSQDKHLGINVCERGVDERNQRT